MRRLPLKPGPTTVLLHGHCHQKSMGLLAPAKALLSRIPGATRRRSRRRLLRHGRLVRLRPRHYEVSRAIGERKLFPAVRGESRRAPWWSRPARRAAIRSHDFTGETAVHPAVLLQPRCLDLDTAHVTRMNLAWLSLGALVVAMIVSCFIELNVGVLALALAWIVGVYSAA